MSYKTIKEIGRGSFGIVYEVDDGKGNRFALKEFFNTQIPGISEDELKQRFKREVKYQSSIENKNVVSIVDCDLSVDPPYFVMELAECSLQDELDKDRTLDGKPGPALFDILSGLEALQELGIVHRDLKPANILKFIEEDGSERYAISDFGLMSPGDQADTRRLTETNRAGGTEKYAAPELASDFKRATIQSDIYSFGAILHDIFSGSDRVPYSELTVPEPDVSHIVQKCTKKLANRRYGSLYELRVDIYEALSSQVNFSSSEEEAVVSILDNNSELSNDEWDRVFLCLEENIKNGFSNGLIFRSISRDHVIYLKDNDLGFLKSLGSTFCEYVMDGSFNFDYCDVLASKLKLYYDVDDVELKSQVLLALLCLGVRHNRFYVERIFANLASHDAPEQVIRRFIIDLEVKKINFNTKVSHLEHSIGISRDQLHDRLQNYLKESAEE